jgi:hypothetical protein
MWRRRPLQIAAGATALRALGARPLQARRAALGRLGVLAALLGAWPASAQMPIEQRVADALGPLPASFIGGPCADCPAIRHQLDLYPDQACAEGADTERALLEVLERGASWRILGEHLELLDADGIRLARFERRLMP